MDLSIGMCLSVCPLPILFGTGRIVYICPPVCSCTDGLAFFVYGLRQMCRRRIMSIGRQVFQLCFARVRHSSARISKTAPPSTTTPLLVLVSSKTPLSRSLLFFLAAKSAYHRRIAHLVQFHECWWDSLIIDLLGANVLGMTLGLYTLRFLETRTYDWNSKEKSYELARSLVRRGANRPASTTACSMDSAGVVLLFLATLVLSERRD